MNKELQAIHDAWDFGDQTTKGGKKRDEKKARSLADKYVAAHPEQFTVLETMSEDAVIHALSVLRDEVDNPMRTTLSSTFFSDKTPDVDDADSWFLLQVWLWHAWEPRQIGGDFQAKARVVH